VYGLNAVALVFFGCLNVLACQLCKGNTVNSPPSGRNIKGGAPVPKESWLLCPVCRNKTRLKVRTDTELHHFPLYCPKCRQETLINVSQSHLTVIQEPDAKTQSR